MLMSDTRTQSGFRSLLEHGSLMGGPAHRLRQEFARHDEKHGPATVATYRIPRIGRVLEIAGDGWVSIYYLTKHV